MNRFDTHEVAVRQFLLIVLSGNTVVVQSREREPLAEQYECVEMSAWSLAFEPHCSVASFSQVSRSRSGKNEAIFFLGIEVATGFRSPE